METGLVQKNNITHGLYGMHPSGSYTFDEIYKLAEVCVASHLFEDVTDAAQAFVKIYKGQELGIPPTTAMAGIDIIRKRLFIKPWIIAAKINTCGYGAYRVVSQNDEACSILFRRKYPGEGWVDCPVETYTFAEAKGHGLTERSDHWKVNPAHMLYQRAMGRGGAKYFPELLGGMEPARDDTPISEEEHATNILDLMGDQQSVQDSLEAARRGTTTSVVSIEEPPDMEGAVSNNQNGLDLFDSAQTETPQPTVSAKIETILRDHGKTEKEISSFWSKMQKKYNELTPGVMTLIYDGMQRELAKRSSAEQCGTTEGVVV